MKNFMMIKDYNELDGFPIRALRRLAASSRHEEFGLFQTETGKTAPWYVNVPLFLKAVERALEEGELERILQ